MVERYDAVILSNEEYRQNLKIPQLFFLPAIDPFSITNKELTDDEIKERVDHYEISTHLPLGKRARETMRERFLLTRLLEQYLDLFKSLG